MIEITTPITTTVQRRVAGFMRPASLPPSTPPINAPTAITSAADQSTCPEKRKKTAAATLTLNATACFSALRRVSESSSVSPSADRRVSL